MTSPVSLVQRLDARDRALFGRWVLNEFSPRSRMRLWRTLTHVGGARATIAAVLLPLVSTSTALRTAALLATIALGLSHAIVRVVKRLCTRARPTVALQTGAHVDVPDCFSFPSGHACAAMSVAMAYAMVFPSMAAPVTVLAALVGFSRVRLGVHYPGDVLVGQFIAAITVLGIVAMIPGFR